MTQNLSTFAARLRDLISNPQTSVSEPQFSALALELFALQFTHNAAYRKLCVARRVTPLTVAHRTQIPAAPSAAFKEFELTSLAPADRTAVFHSSGTTEQKPSRHFHNAESLATYEAALWPWFQQNILADFQLSTFNFQLLFLTPPPAQAPHSSLVHMFETVRSRACESAESPFLGRVAADGSWTLDFTAALAALSPNSQLPTSNFLLLGTAFSFVHLLDFLAEKNLHLALPPGTRVMETGGYKNRSRALPKAELHTLITKFLGVPPENILCEYGMSELSSQAYDAGGAARVFRFPPWACAQIISPETGREVADGETGLIRVFDLANVFSVMAVQTEDLAVRHGNGFELIGRAVATEPRGCSLMTA
ncbi:MAG: hypothetical protein NTZ16_10780 [Verrucomicrobia bacterium]|nr:hypothetical protein [Verrucomicrobiota bacterium]